MTTLLDMRESLGLTQEELAEKADLTRTQLSRIECGLINKPNSETLQKLADAFEVTRSEIVEALRNTHKQHQAEQQPAAAAPDNGAASA